MTLDRNGTVRLPRGLTSMHVDVRPSKHHVLDVEQAAHAEREPRSVV